MKKDKKIYLIGNAHLDPVWQWVWQEGFAEVKATFRSALDRMKEFPDYKFTSACSSYYMWIEKSDKEMFEEIKMRVKEGRWCIVGGQFIQPDCNLPSGESFARHSLISQRYFKEKFGVYAKTGYNVDSFGHNGNMPLILKNSKMDNYVFMRPGKHEKELPQSYFKWRSKDGSEVYTFRILDAYGSGLAEIYMPFLDNLKELPKSDEPSDLMGFYGIGNHGGGPTIELLKWMEDNLGEEFIYSTPDEFFEKAKHNELPVIEDDLQFHAKGCYSAISKIKADNRRCETEVLAAEKYSVLSKELMGTPYPKSELTRAWHNIMFNQFHDILGGCSLKDAYTDAAYSHGESMAIAQRETNFALQQISWNIDTTIAARPDKSGKIVSKKWQEWNNIGRTLVVFNPNDHAVNAVIPTREFAQLITDSEGNTIPLQRRRDFRNAEHDDNVEKGTHLTVFRDELPPFGYKTYHCWNDSGWVQPQSKFDVSENSIENEVLKLTLDSKTGEIASIYYKSLGRELLEGGTDTVLIDESEWDTWAHNATAFKKVVETAEKGSVRILENGPVCATLRSEQCIGGSKIFRDYTILPNDSRVYVKTVIDFHEEHKMLKFCTKVNVENPKSVCEIPFGYIERKTNGDEQPCEGWISLYDEKGGIAIANDSKYSYDAEGNVLSLTVLRSPLYCNHVGGISLNENLDYCGQFTDQGIHEFEYVIFPFKNYSDCKKKTDELNMKPVLIQETFHKGRLCKDYQGIEINTENITVTAIKNSEDDLGIVVRFQETAGKDTEFSVRLFDNKFNLKIGHNALKTVMITNDGSIIETDFIEDIIVSDKS